MRFYCIKIIFIIQRDSNNKNLIWMWFFSLNISVLLESPERACARTHTYIHTTTTTTIIFIIIIFGKWVLLIHVILYISILYYLNVSPLFLNIRKILLLTWTMRENDSEPQLSSKFYQLGWHQKIRLANHGVSISWLYLPMTPSRDKPFLLFQEEQK